MAAVVKHIPNVLEDVSHIINKRESQCSVHFAGLSGEMMHLKSYKKILSGLGKLSKMQPKLRKNKFCKPK